MQRVDRRKFINKLKSSVWVYFFLIILASVFVYSAVGAYSKSRLANDKLDIAQKELTDLENQKFRLTAELENANTDFGQEKALREKFNVVKEGEQVIMIVNKKDENIDFVEEEKSFFGRIFDR